MQTDTRTELVNHVVKCFKDMGANEHQLKTERERLATDDGYLEEWTEAIPYTKKAEKKSVWRSLLDVLLLKG